MTSAHPSPDHDKRDNLRATAGIEGLNRQIHVDRAVQQRSLEYVWHSVSRTNRGYERIFCFTGGLFLLLLLKLACWPSSGLVSLEIAILLSSLGGSIALLPIMIYGVLPEWRAYRAVVSAAASREDFKRSELGLLWDFLREKRPSM